MNAKLTKSVIRQLGSRDYLQDVANHGADSGFPGFTYYSDTVKFFRNHRAEIVELVKNYADDFGETPLQFVAGFRCLSGNYSDSDGEAEIARALYGRLEADDTQIPNALAWFALEEVAREECDK